MAAVQSVRGRHIAVWAIVAALSATAMGFGFDAPCDRDDIRAELANRCDSRPASAYLSSLHTSRRDHAHISVELPGDAPSAQLILAREVQRLWNTGRHAQALRHLRTLETSPLPVAVGVNWLEPRPLAAPGGRGEDVRVGEPNTGADKMVLDHDAGTGHLFAVVRWPHGWSVNISTDNGATWAETWYLGIGVHEIIDVDAAVVGDYLYVGYVHEAYAHTPRARRCFVTDGSVDVVYSYQEVYNSLPNDVTHLAVESNADDNDNRLYVLTIETSGAVRFHFTDEDGGAGTLPWTDLSPSVNDAASGLDAHFNSGYDTYYLFASYLATNGRVRGLRASGGDWDDFILQYIYAGSSARTAVSAYDDTVVCAYEHAFLYGQGIVYGISQDAGDTWSFEGIVMPAPGEGWYWMADITARGGAGIAAVYQQETGELDKIFCSFQSGYSGGPFNDPVQINDYDTFTYSWTAINWIPPMHGGPEPYGYGMVYLSGEWPDLYPYFDRFDSPPDYCTASAGCMEHISRVQLGDIDNSSACTFYGDYTDLSTEMEIGADYEATITVGAGQAEDWGGLWIDWNGDFDFDDAGELTSLGPGVGPYVATVTPPAGAALGDTRMRVRVQRGGPLDPCGTTTFGEVEDYTITIIEPQPCPEDVNGDGVVDVLDLLAVIAAWGNPGGPEDINNDGIVDVLDLLAVIAAWGPC